MQRSIESDFEDENEICYTSKRRAHPLVQHYDDESLPSSSWTNPNENELEDDQRSSSIDYYQNGEDLEDQIFHLPISSNDLSVTPQQALHLATVYEFLRHFSPILRLSPFLFEHFCTSIIQSNDINNILCSQIHICLLRLLIKQDDDDGITYASETDIKGIIDLSFVTMDYITWPYILQLYVTSHPQLKMLTTIIREYPFHTTVDEKIDVLLALCNVVLTTKTIRREFDDTKPKQHDDNCRQCQKRGDLLCCDRCEATYHLACLNPPLTSVPTVEWFCPVCEQNQVHGVTDCIPPRENRPFYLRHRCIGHDREQRRYWFVCRRLFVEDEIGEDVRYYSTLDQFDALLSCLDERGPERLLVYRLQKRYNDIARCMQITADLQASSIPLDVSPMTTIIHPALDYVPQLDDEDDDHKPLSMFTDGLMPCHFEAKLIKQIDYEHLLDRIKLKINLNEDTVVMHGQIDGIVDNDDDTNEKETKSMVKKREFFVHSTNDYAYSSEYNGQKHYTNDFSKPNDLIPLKRFHSSNRSLLEERLRHAHNIYSDTEVALRRMNENDIDETIWQRYEQYQTMNRFPSHHRGNTYSNMKTRPYPTIHPSYPRSNYYRDYYTGNNYEDEDGMLLDNEYDDFGDDFFHQEENIDEFDMPFRKYESNRVYRGTTRGRPRGRGRPPLYGGRAGRGSHFGHPPRGVNHLTTGSFQSSQRLIQPKTESPKLHEQQPMRNKRKPAKIKPVTVTTQEEKPRRPGKVLRSGRISRKPRRDSETDFGSDNSDDSGAKDKETGSDDDDDEEFDLTQLGLGFGNTSNVVVKGGRDGSSSSTDSLAGTNRPLTNFAAFAQSQLLSANLANGLIETNEDLSDDSDFSVDGFETDESDDILSEKIKNNSENIDDEELDDFTYSQTMVSLINSIQPSHVKIDLDLVAQNKTSNRNKGDIHPSDGHLHYENSYQSNPLATKKQMLLSERDRRAHLARKFSINNSPSFAWYSSSSSITSNYFLKHLSDILRLTLVYFENTIPLPFMHSHWKRYRYIWARQLLDLDSDLSLAKLIHLLLQFEACIKPVSYFDLFTDQVGYIKFRRETEKERDEAKKEEKDAFIRRKIDADSIIQTVHFTRPLKHSIHKQRGEEYRLAGGQGWTFIRSTRRSIIETKTKKKFDINSLLTRRENMSNVISNERHRIINLLETKLKGDLGSEGNVDNELNNLLLTSKDDNDDFIDDLAFINYKIIDYNGSSYRYPVVSEDTRRPFHLTAATSEKKDLTNPFQLPLPWTFSFDDQIPANIFILPSYILRRLARASMTLIDAPGFINSRLSGIGTRFGWPYPCGRPSVRTAWCYKVQTSTSFFAMAHHIKYLWNCIRWDLITEKLSNIDESSITTHVDNDGVATTIQVLAKRDSGPYDSYCEYFVRRTCHTHTNDPFNFNIPISKSRSRAVPHPSSILTPNRLILTEQWLPERQLQPNQIKYYYQSLLDKSYRRLHKKSNDEKKKSRKPSPLINSATQQTAKPFIVRIPHLQPKSTLNTESGKVVIVKATGESPSTNLALQQKSFSVVKLADGQIILVPTATVQPNETPVSKIIKAPSPPKSQLQSVSISPQERRLRPIAPAPLTVIPSTNELLNSLLAQQQQQLLFQQQSDTMPHFEAIVTEDTPLTTISETVTINIHGSTAKPTPVVAQRTKNVRKSAPIATASDDKKLKIDPEEGIRLRICEAILRALIGRIEREQNQESMKKRLKNQTTIVQPKSDPRQIVLTRLLNERVDSLRQEFIGNRLNIKTALVKEQVQTQRLKQQQLILKQQQQQQQQQATTVKQEEIVLDHEDKKLHTPSPPIPVKKARKSTGNEVKTKRQGTTKTSEQKIKSTQPKRTRPLPPTKTADNDQQPPAKKARRSHVLAPPSEQRESSDNDENLLKNRKTSSSSSTTNTTTTIAKMKSTEKSKKIITIKNSSNKKEKTEINLSDINCSCHRTDTPEKFFIQCEICSRWLHGTCVGLTPRLAEKMKEFICEDCSLLTQKAKERLYCICQTPYEEAKFYIGCDVCADWLHGSCVSITPEQAEKFEVYVCPRCSTAKKQEFLNKPINNDIKKDLLTLTDQLLTHKMAWPFQKPVDMKDVPNYYTIIKEPMDLTTLKTKVMNSKFQTICDYIRDVNKIFNNCRLFNPINSTFALCANVVDNYFRQLLENFMIKDDH